MQSCSKTARTVQVLFPRMLHLSCNQQKRCSPGLDPALDLAEFPTLVLSALAGQFGLPADVAISWLVGHC